MLSLTKGRSKLDVSRSKVALGLRASPYHWCHGTRDSTTQALEATRGPARPGLRQLSRGQRYACASPQRTSACSQAEAFETSLPFGRG